MLTFNSFEWLEKLYDCFVHWVSFILWVSWYSIRISMIIVLLTFQIFVWVSFLDCCGLYLLDFETLAGQLSRAFATIQNLVIFNITYILGSFIAVVCAEVTALVNIVVLWGIIVVKIVRKRLLMICGMLKKVLVSVSLVECMLFFYVCFERVPDWADEWFFVSIKIDHGLLIDGLSLDDPRIILFVVHDFERDFTDRSYIMG